jgi:hypothetical protein
MHSVVCVPLPRTPPPQAAVIGYPAVCMSSFQLFSCVAVDSSHWLVADMTLQCYTPVWWRHAVGALAVLAVVGLGFPVGIMVVLGQRRGRLYGPVSASTRRRMGFMCVLYVSLGRLRALSACGSPPLKLHIV